MSPAHVHPLDKLLLAKKKKELTTQPTISQLEPVPEIEEVSFVVEEPIFEPDPEPEPEPKPDPEPRALLNLDPKPKRFHSNNYLNEILNMFDCQVIIEHGKFMVATGTIRIRRARGYQGFQLEKLIFKLLKDMGLPIQYGRGVTGVPDFKIGKIRVELKSTNDGLRASQFTYIANHPKQLILVLFLKVNAILIE